MSLFSTEYDKIFMENFDIMDEETRSTYVSLDEAEKSQVLVSLTSKLYDKIVEKVDNIDYGSIPKSKGDITKIENYESMMECIDIIREILKQYGQDDEPVDVVYTAINNIREREKLFAKAFAIGTELPIILYNTMCLSIVSAVSFLIASSIEFIKNPGDDSFTVSLDKVAYQKTAKNMLFEDLRRFNKGCMNKSIDEALEYTIKSNVKGFTGTTAIGVMVGVTAIIGMSRLIIPMLQELTYFFYHSRQNISDYFAIQADLITMNTGSLVYKDMDDNRKNAIVKKQTKIADKFRKISNTFAIDNKSSEKEAKKTIESEKKKYKISDVMDTNPDGGEASSLF